jgi:hypothetical protein
MRSEVYVAATAPACEEFLYDRDDGPARSALRHLWSAWGRLPHDPAWRGDGSPCAE